MMNKGDFHELAGRIEGTTRALLLLVAHLDCTDKVDGQAYSDDLRKLARSLQMQADHQGATQRTLNEVAKSLEQNRPRQARVYSEKNQRGDDALRLFSGQVRRQYCGTHRGCICASDWHHRH